MFLKSAGLGKVSRVSGSLIAGSLPETSGSLPEMSGSLPGTSGSLPEIAGSLPADCLPAPGPMAQKLSSKDQGRKIVRLASSPTPTPPRGQSPWASAEVNL